MSVMKRVARSGLATVTLGFSLVGPPAAGIAAAESLQVSPRRRPVRSRPSAVRRDRLGRPGKPRTVARRRTRPWRAPRFCPARAGRGRRFCGGPRCDRGIGIGIGIGIGDAGARPSGTGRRFGPAGGADRTANRVGSSYRRRRRQQRDNPDSRVIGGRGSRAGLRAPRQASAISASRRAQVCSRLGGLTPKTPSQHGPSPRSAQRSTRSSTPPRTGCRVCPPARSPSCWRVRCCWSAAPLVNIFPPSAPDSPPSRRARP